MVPASGYNSKCYKERPADPYDLEQGREIHYRKEYKYLLTGYEEDQY